MFIRGTTAILPRTTAVVRGTKGGTCVGFTRASVTTRPTRAIGLVLRADVDRATVTLAISATLTVSPLSAIYLGP